MFKRGNRPSEVSHNLGDGQNLFEIGNKKEMGGLV